MSTIIQIGENKVEIDGTAAFVAHMQGLVLKALWDAPLGVGRAPARRRGRPKKTARRKVAAKRKPASKGRPRRGGRQKGSKVIGGKVYTAAQLKAKPGLLKKAGKS